MVFKKKSILKWNTSILKIEALLIAAYGIEYGGGGLRGARLVEEK